MNHSKANHRLAPLAVLASLTLAPSCELGSAALTHDITFSTPEYGDIVVGEYQPAAGIATFYNFAATVERTGLSIATDDASLEISSEALPVAWPDLDLPIDQPIPAIAHSDGAETTAGPLQGTLRVSPEGHEDDGLSTLEVKGPKIGSCHRGTANSSNIITPPVHVEEIYLRTFFSTSYDSYGRAKVYYKYREVHWTYLPKGLGGGGTIVGQWRKIERIKWRHCTSTHYAV